MHTWLKDHDPLVPTSITLSNLQLSAIPTPIEVLSDHIGIPLRYNSDAVSIPHSRCHSLLHRK